MGTLADNHSSEKERLLTYHQNFLSSILVPEEFSGGQETCLISSFGFVCNCGSVVELIELEVVKHGSIWTWRWHWGYQ